MSFLGRVFRPPAMAALERENAELREKLEAVESESKLADRVWFLEVENRKLKGMQPNAELTNSKVIDELREALSTANGELARWQRKVEFYVDRLKEDDAKLSVVSQALRDEQFRANRLRGCVSFLESRVGVAWGKLGGKTKAFNAMARKAEANKKYLGRFYWPATAYCEATLPCT